MDAVKRRAVKTLVSKLTSIFEQMRMEAICELRFLSKNDADSRPLIAEANAVPLIAESLYSPVVILQENATATLLNLSISSKDYLMSSHGVLDALSHALRHPATPFSGQCAAAMIFSLLSVDTYRPIIGHKRDIIFGLVEIVRGQGSMEPDQNRLHRRLERARVREYLLLNRELPSTRKHSKFFDGQ